jgi:hypothetical protein
VVHGRWSKDVRRLDRGIPIVSIEDGISREMIGTGGLLTEASLIVCPAGGRRLFCQQLSDASGQGSLKPGTRMRFVQNQSDRRSPETLGRWSSRWYTASYNAIISASLGETENTLSLLISQRVWRHRGRTDQDRVTLAFLIVVQPVAAWLSKGAAVEGCRVSDGSLSVSNRRARICGKVAIS